MTDGELAEGVRALDHTADVGIEVEADSLPGLFERAAIGAFALIAGADEDGVVASVAADSAGPRVEERLELEAEDVAGLLALWLRELLFLHDVRGLAFTGAAFDSLDEKRLRATVLLGRDTRPPVREVKGVTYHGLEAKRTDGSWRARVIFDV